MLSHSSGVNGASFLVESMLIFHVLQILASSHLIAIALGTVLDINIFKIWMQYSNFKTISLPGPVN